MSETQLLSDILNDSPCTELLRLRNREIIVLFLYETFYKHREPVRRRTSIYRNGRTKVFSAIIRKKAVRCSTSFRHIPAR